MAYFANGTEGMRYEARWCDDCVHCEGCPVMTLHMMWNYDQGEYTAGKARKLALDLLIPMEPVKMPDGKTVDFPGKCRMFLQVQR